LVAWNSIRNITNTRDIKNKKKTLAKKKEQNLKNIIISLCIFWLKVTQY